MARKRTPQSSPSSRTTTLARQADRYDLYLRSVQCPEHEVAFLRRMYRDALGGRPHVLREDFCGTFAVCCHWVKGGSSCRAIGVDLDPEPLTWGRRHHLAKLSAAQQQRVTLLQQDVRRVAGPKADIVAAENFSYCIFKTRHDLLHYFRAARANLAVRGLFVLDVMGGSESFEDGYEETTRQHGFNYVWEHHQFDPITHHAQLYIHFHFKDGSKLRRAFGYDWRLWTIPELRDALADAGFRRTSVYWEDADGKTGRGNNVWRRRTKAPAERAWVAYVVAEK